MDVPLTKALETTILCLPMIFEISKAKVWVVLFCSYFLLRSHKTNQCLLPPQNKKVRTRGGKTQIFVDYSSGLQLVFTSRSLKVINLRITSELINFNGLAQYVDLLIIIIKSMPHQLWHYWHNNITKYHSWVFCASSRAFSSPNFF